jgi:para-aminobenzoate synthetase component 1
MKDVLMINAEAEELFCRLACFPGAMFLDSSMQDKKLGRFSIILVDPFAELVVNNERTRFRRLLPSGSDAVSSKPGSIYPFHCDSFVIEDNPLRVIGKMMEYFRVKALRNSDPEEVSGSGKETGSDALPCENGCAAGYLSYDLGFSIEKIRERTVLNPEEPTAILNLYDISVVVDHESQTAYICAADRIPGVSPDRLLQRMLRIREKAKNPSKSIPFDRSGFQCNLPKSDFSREEYREMVRKAKDCIRDGDIYQVNLSQRFSGSFSGDPYIAYRELRRACPAPFSAYMSFDSLHILSSSPERFFETDGDTIRARPIKGTRPRGETPEMDRALLRELSESEKDRAELTMIVDLLRNDLGRICRLGSVRVEKLCEWETYENVFHQVATIRGELSNNIGAEELLRAVFPGGSITGAPKIRAMEIIEQLEPLNRGIYTGSLGYFGFDGRTDMNIAIRTLVCCANQFYYQVGGGIVWDSVPDEEYDETLHKGRSIYRTLESFVTGDKETRDVFRST